MNWPDGTPKSTNNAFSGAIYRPEETETDRREAAMQKVAAERTMREQLGSADDILKARHGGAYTRA